MGMQDGSFYERARHIQERFATSHRPIYISAIVFCDANRPSVVVLHMQNAPFRISAILTGPIRFQVVTSYNHGIDCEREWARARSMIRYTSLLH